ncbi:ABC transporter substrate-binding protein [Methylobacterium oryzae CBMB20]
MREAGLRVETVTEPPSPEGVLDKIETVGRLAALEREAEALEAEVRAHFADLAARRARIARAARALVVLSVQGGRTVVGGAGSSADGILTLAESPTRPRGWRASPMTDEAIVAAAPDAVVMMQNGPEPPRAESIFAPGTAPRPDAGGGAGPAGGHGRPLPPRLRAAHARGRHRPDAGALPGPAA